MPRELPALRRSIRSRGDATKDRGEVNVIGTKHGQNEGDDCGLYFLVFQCFHGFLLFVEVVFADGFRRVFDTVNWMALVDCDQVSGQH